VPRFTNLIAVPVFAHFSVGGTPAIEDRGCPESKPLPMPSAL
jgi:hypothetical protein